MRYIETIHAQGHVLCHDITVIVKDVKKGVAFKKGHVVTEEDIPELLKLGKDHLYVWEKDDTCYHEDEAAEILRDVCMGQNMRPPPPQEGKIELIAPCDGLLTIDSARLEAVNAIEEIMIATRHGFTPVKAGDKLAGTRVIPLVIKKEKMERGKRVAGETPLLQVLPFRPLRCGIVTTGNEVFYGRIQDTFTPVIEQKLKDYGMTVMGHTLCPDDPQKITAAILELRDQGAELIMTRRHECGPRRPHARGHSCHGGAYGDLRRAGAAGRHDAGGLSPHRKRGDPCAGPAGMRDVCQAHGV